VRTVCAYGATCAPFVEATAHALRAHGSDLDVDIVPLTIEGIIKEPWRGRHAERVYVLPFDLPPDLPTGEPVSAAGVLRTLFPEAAIVNSPAAHEVCWDKIASAERLLARGVPVPDTLITHAGDEAREFVARHEQAILKAPRSCGGAGDLVVFCDDEGTIAGEARARRYVVELDAEATQPRLADAVLSWPPPFYLQRLVAGTGRGGVSRPPQVLRAYVVDGHVTFWTERYRDRFQRPSDFILSVGLGARYRFLPDTSEEARKLAARAAEVLDVRVGVVDIVRAGTDGPYVIDVDTDGYHMLIDRSFTELPEFRATHDFDRYIAELLAAPVVETATRVLGRVGDQSKVQGPKSKVS
jgi:glutathione synthase/RimK-type ligase-like ATP-grasp enzyme